MQEPTSDPSPEAELASFQLHEGFEINLFADESLGIANPIAIHWDAKGRLWVLTTLAYAQLKPGERPDDKLFILEDTDGDGKADKASVFADGLDMPTGFALGYGGVFVGQSADLLFLKDIDDDGKADTREVMLTGFGFGDTHQNISNLNWDNDGRLYFCQGLHTYSRVETPWGIVRGDTAGFWRFDPRTLKLEPFGFPALVSQNPCGITVDKRGDLFVKSNNRELIFATPALVPTTHQLDLVPVASIGVTPGKSMGGEYVESRHLPDWIQGHILIAGYYSHRVTAFPLVADGSGFARVEPAEVLVSSHESFRPVDIRIGPDGAIYVADWFNPIIGHYQASLRHPDRDKTHGRIWRVTAKDRPLASMTPLAVARMPDEKTAPLPDSEPPRELANLSPHERLDAIVRWANIAKPESLKYALGALDGGSDRFIDYALTQMVHARSQEWVPAFQSGQLHFIRPEHLAFALEALGGSESAEIAREKLSEAKIDPSVRARFAKVLAKVGSPDDLSELLNGPQPDAGVLDALVEAWPARQQRPSPPFAPRLRELFDSPDVAVRAAALKLAGLWQVKPLAEPVRQIADDTTQPNGVRIPAFHALARLEGKGAVDAIATVAENQDAELILRRGAVEALALVDVGRAAAVTAHLLASEPPSDLSAGFLVPFLNRKGGSDVLAAALGSAGLKADRAQALVTALSEMGRSEPKLSAVLNEALGVQSGARPYSPDFVKQLATEVRESGDPKAGQAVFQRAQLTCTACHQIGGVGGILGPNLDTVGAGLPLDLIIESVLWPDRQLKEGYFAVSVTTKEGQVFTGYEEKEAEGILWLRDTATGQTTPIPPQTIAERKNIGTLMPAGLTNSLERTELRDLVAYLASLKGSAQ
ncbi:MAG: c-type cytochrome [Verrucomicrobiae bacterium]|nr:c-type cytochrome [Verrucomicrobiae bacterium]